jgi:hypothetical protein
MPGKMVPVTDQSPSPGAARNFSVLEAVLERITYANEDTGYTIARVATERIGPDLLTVVGALLGAQVRASTPSRCRDVARTRSSGPDHLSFIPASARRYRCGYISRGLAGRAG